MITNTHSSCVQSSPRAERIARLNDALRKTGLGGQIMVTKMQVQAQAATRYGQP